MADFPTLSTQQDQKFYDEVPEDTGMKAETDGGYEITRPRHTRRGRLSFSTGFTNISDADKAALLSFYNSVGTFNMFNWTRPTGGAAIVVRFVKPPKFKYSHAVNTGGVVSHRWDTDTIELKEV
jgi:hypothetical protein